jgi:hypothetical protein
MLKAFENAARLPMRLLERSRGVRGVPTWSLSRAKKARGSVLRIIIWQGQRSHNNPEKAPEIEDD